MLGLGQDIEVWGLRQTALEGCPEFAPYLGQVNALRRKYAPILMHGVYRDTLGASVTEAAGQPVSYAVLDGGPAGKALVVRNPSVEPVRVSAELSDVAGKRLVLARPGQDEIAPAGMPVAVVLGLYEAAILLALGS